MLPKYASHSAECAYNSLVCWNAPHPNRISNSGRALTRGHRRIGWSFKQPRDQWLLLWTILPLLIAKPNLGFAGGSGLNVAIVANSLSSNSTALANYYRVRRNVPADQVLCILWPGGNVEWTQAEFSTALLNPILSFLAERQLTNQIQYVVLSMDLPYRVTGARPNSTTSALFYGFKAGTKDLTNSYAASEARFCEAPPATASTNSFLTMMLTAGSLDQAKHLVDQGVVADGSLPGFPAWLAKSSDPVRNIRYRAYDNAVFNTRLVPAYSLVRTNLDSPWGLTNVLGYQTGLANFGMSPDAFLPGAIADSFSSFGGKIFETTGQSSLLTFIHAGATASYGTITEPQPIVKKFPDPLVYFYQARGYSAAEAYYQSIEIPLEGLLVGEPLAAPFRRQFGSDWTGIEDGDVVTATTNLTLAFRADRPGQTVESVALFVDGKFHQTLTNFSPQAGNRLAVRLNGYEIVYQVPGNSNIRFIASEMANLLNSPVHTNVTKTIARAYGDRIELQSSAPMLPPGTFEFVDHDASSNSPRSYLAVLDQAWTQPVLHGVGWDSNGGFHLGLSSNPGVRSTVYASSNLVQWLPIHTNVLGGLAEFVDADAASHPRRFYRLAIPADVSPPRLSPLGTNVSGEFQVRVASSSARPYFLQASSDLRLWSDVVTNQLGGELLFADPLSPTRLHRFYRTRSANPADYSSVVVLGPVPGGGHVLQVQANHSGDTVVWASTNSTDWFPIYRHAGESVVLTEVTSEIGSAAYLGATLQVAQPEFLTTTAYGLCKFSVNTNAGLLGNDLIGITVTKTNGNVVSVSVTNQSALSDLKSFVQQFVNAVNAEPALTATDGLVAEDLVDGNVGAVDLNLRARSMGRDAAAIQVAFQYSTNLTLSVTGAVALDWNINDLRARNHLFVSAGLPTVSLNLPFDTAGLADGYHELTGVAYEGTSVHTQTRRSVTIVVSNSPLQASISAPTNAVAITNGFEVTVTANTNSVSEILLFTTGGFLAGVTNQPAASFAVNGQPLGTGEHPFHALVTTTNGLRYRTDTRTVVLVDP